MYGYEGSMRYWLLSRIHIFLACSWINQMTMAVPKLIWAASWQNQQNDMCALWRLRSVWASAQSDQSLRCSLIGLLRTQAFFMRTANTLICLGGCPGWSESSLGALSILLVLVWGGSFHVSLFFLFGARGGLRSLIVALPGDIYMCVSVNILLYKSYVSIVPCLNDAINFLYDTEKVSIWISANL